MRRTCDPIGVMSEEKDPFFRRNEDLEVFSRPPHHHHTTRETLEVFRFSGEEAQGLTPLSCALSMLSHHGTQNYRRAGRESHGVSKDIQLINR